ncbi:MAG: SDR family oxidoreductase [Alphaproteobacteria bacterium]
MKVTGKTVIVTGGANGIGEALARKFAAEGAKGIVVADMDIDNARKVAADIGGIATETNVANEQSIQDMVKAAEDAFGPVDLMCSNAGIGRGDGEQGWATSASNKDFQDCFDINVMAHIYAARALLPSMIERGEGYFLHTCSAAGLLSQIGSAAYSVTKAAAVSFGESLAITHGDDGIGVSLLCPQGVDTAMLRAGDDDNPASRDGVLSPEQVADCVVQGLADESFLILPHPIVTKFMQNKSGDYDRWVGGMRKYRRTFAQTNTFQGD